MATAFEGNGMITRDNATERLPQQYVAEASEIGLAPGMWPNQLQTSLGNGRPFLLHKLERDRDGDIYLARYRQELGSITLRVFND
jgi:hypothetical protein